MELFFKIRPGQTSRSGVCGESRASFEEGVFTTQIPGEPLLEISLPEPPQGTHLLKGHTLHLQELSPREEDVVNRFVQSDEYDLGLPEGNPDGTFQVTLREANGTALATLHYQTEAEAQAFADFAFEALEDTVVA